ncbi:MAG: hypothetical protein LUE31_07355 [Lachnospiraceae bacterium]|nr:hypothetical protein [Lachnospiraceae bacterium]
MKLAKDQSGSALLTAVLLIAAIAVMGMAALGMSLKNYQTAQGWVSEMNSDYSGSGGYNGYDTSASVTVDNMPMTGSE